MDKKKSAWIFVLIMTAIVMVDQIVKILVKTNMQIGEDIPLIGEWCRLHFIENEGFAFGATLGGTAGKIILTLFRMFSRNHEKRSAENRKYIELTSGWKTKLSQFIKRTKNRRDYRYFKCPNCKVLLRMKRGSGEKDITCVRCGHQFKMKS